MSFALAMCWVALIFAVAVGKIKMSIGSKEDYSDSTVQEFDEPLTTVKNPVRGCTGKKRYTAKEATEVVLRLKKNYGIQLLPQRCQHCKWHHLRR